MSPLAIYLRNHEAAASAGYDLFRRASSNQRKKPYAAELTELAAEVRDDLGALRFGSARGPVGDALAVSDEPEFCDSHVFRLSSPCRQTSG